MLCNPPGLLQQFWEICIGNCRGSLEWISLLIQKKMFNVSLHFSSYNFVDIWAIFWNWHLKGTTKQVWCICPMVHKKSFNCFFFLLFLATKIVQINSKSQNNIAECFIASLVLMWLFGSWEVISSCSSLPLVLTLCDQPESFEHSKNRPCHEAWRSHSLSWQGRQLQHIICIIVQNNLPWLNQYTVLPHLKIKEE